VERQKSMNQFGNDSLTVHPALRLAGKDAGDGPAGCAENA
jgi:hypothetical protein